MGLILIKIGHAIVASGHKIGKPLIAFGVKLNPKLKNPTIKEKR